MPVDVFPVFRSVAVAALAALAPLAVLEMSEVSGLAGAGPIRLRDAQRGVGAPAERDRGVGAPGVRIIGQTGASRFALAQVADSRGAALVDVGADDFVVQESGAEREILDVRVADYPIVVVLDNGAGAIADFPSMRAAATRFVERLGPRPVAVATAGGTPKLAASFDDERAVLLAQLSRIEPARTESSQPLGAAALAAETIRSTGTLFAAIVALTASPMEVAGPAADPLLAPIIDSRAVLHVVARGANSAGVGATDQLLRGLVDQTHGDFTAIYAPASYQPAVDRLVTRLTTELLIEYIVPVGSKASDVKIGVRIPGARVRGLGVAPR